MNAVAGSGTSFMSDSWIAWKPRIEDPSNICPTVKKSSSTDSAGTLKCCMTPGRSQNRMSTSLTSSSLMNVRTSSAELNIQPPDVGRGRLPVVAWRAPRIEGRPRAVVDDTTDWRFLGHDPHVSRVLRMGRPGQRARTRSRYAGAVVDRKDFGSWLQGPRERTSADGQYRGRDLGLPPRGPGSVAGFGIRFVGVLIDWGIASVIARGLFGVPLPFSQPPASGSQGFVVLAVFGVMHLLLGGTGRVLPLQALARTLLLCMFIPAVVWDRDGRGLHDKVPGTVIVRTR